MPNLASVGVVAAGNVVRAPKPPRAEPTPLAYRINDAAQIAGISRSSVYKLIREGQLRAIKVAGVRLVLKDELLGLLGVNE